MRCARGLKQKPSSLCKWHMPSVLGLIFCRERVVKLCKYFARVLKSRHQYLSIASPSVPTKPQFKHQSIIWDTLDLFIMLCSLCKPFLVGDHSIAKHRHELPRVIPTHATHPKRPDVHCQLADSTAETPSPLPRRAILSLAAAAMALASGGIPPSLAASPSSVGASPLPQTFTSSEGFEFSFPNGWVVAYDRSGGRGDGAVVAVGDFTRFLVVSVFRTVDVPDQVRKNGLDDASGRTLCLDSLAAAESTMRFKEIRSEAGANRKNQYDFEYEIETCRGEIQEGSGGVLRCLVSC